MNQGHFWIKWEPTAWLASETRLELSPLERCVYRDLLDCNYVQGNLPNDPKILSGLAAVTPSEFRKAWPKVSMKFVDDSDNPGRITNLRVKAVLNEAQAKSSKRAEAGRLGGKQSGSKRGSSASLSAEANAKQCFDFAEARRSTYTEHSPQPPSTASGRIPDELQAAFDACMALHPNCTDPDAAARAFISLAGSGKITLADAPLMVPGMKRWVQCADWVDGDPKFMGKGPAKEFYSSFAAWVRERAWLSKPKPSANAEAEAEAEKREYFRAPADWNPSHMGGSE